MPAQSDSDVSTASGRFLFLQSLAQRYFGRVLGDTCHDLAVETWLRCEAKLSQVRSNVKAWLRAALYHRFISQVRRREYMLLGDDVVAGLCEGHDAALPPGVELEHLQGQAFVEQVLDSLPERQREAVSLRVEHNGECPANWDDRLDNAFRVAKRKLLAMPEVLELAHDYGYC